MRSSHPNGPCGRGGIPRPLAWALVCALLPAISATAFAAEGTTGDTRGAPFVVTDVFPPDGAVDVHPSTSVVLRLSVPVDAATLGPANVRVVDITDGGAIPSVSRLGPDGRTIVLDPVAPLPAEHAWAIVVTAGLESASGTAASPFASYFRTNEVPDPTPLGTAGELSATFGEGSQLGRSVAPAGDLNGDGLDDWLAGAPAAGSGSSAGVGRVAVYLGSTDPGERATPDIVFTGVGVHDRAGTSVAGNFDFNDDGNPDLLIGAEQFNRSPVNVPACDSGDPCGPGRAYLIYFDPADYPSLGIPGMTDFVSLSAVGVMGGIKGAVFTGIALGDQVGFAVAAGGLANANSIEDIAIGAPGFDTTGEDAGAVFVVFDDGALTGPVSLARVLGGTGEDVPGFTLAGGMTGDRLGHAVAFGPGYVQGSLHDQSLIVGQPGVDNPLTRAGETDSGATVVVDIGELDTDNVEVCEIGSTLAGFQIFGDQDGEQLGFAVGSGGDHRFDDVPDLLMGAPFYDDGAAPDAGRVVQLSAALTSGMYAASEIGVSIGGAIWVGEASDDFLGSSVAGLGDVNGDVLDDILLGAPLADPTLAGGSVSDAGASYLIHGTIPADPFGGVVSVGDVGDTISGETLAGGAVGDQSGRAVAALGDVDGDGDDDAAVGAPLDDVGTDNDSGTVTVLLDTGPQVSAECSVDGCTVADLATGARLLVPAGVLPGPTALTIDGHLAVADLPVEPPAGQLLLGAVSGTPAGLTVTASTLVLPIRPELSTQVSFGESFELWELVADVWQSTGVSTTSTVNIDFPPNQAAAATIDAQGDYALFLPDQDEDDVRDSRDNCPADPNADQTDGDGDGSGDACDPCTDSDGDGLGDPGAPNPDCPVTDLCPDTPGGTVDPDGDGVGAVCDNCPDASNAGQSDGDGDGVGDACEGAPLLTVSSDPADAADFATVQEAVDAAGVPGTRIEVFPGIGAYGPVVIDRGFDLTIAGRTNGAEVTLSGLGGSSPTVQVLSGTRGQAARVTLEALTLSGLTGIRALADTRLAGVAVSAARGLEVAGSDVEVFDSTFAGFNQEAVLVGPNGQVGLERVSIANGSGSGVRTAGLAELTNVFIAAAQDGVELLASGTLVADFVTITGGTVGVDNDNGGQVTLSHALVALGSVADLQGVDCAWVETSLIGDQDCGGTNVTGDPMLDAGGALPLPGSPAIDLGVDAGQFSGDPCTDLAGDARLRDGDGDGMAQLDAGAWEVGDPNGVEEVIDVAFDGTEALVWSAVTGAEQYQVYRGALEQLPAGSSGDCVTAEDSDPTDTSFPALPVPPSGFGDFYLVTAEVAGSEGTAGFATCVERPQPAACPSRISLPVSGSRRLDRDAGSD